MPRPKGSWTGKANPKWNGGRYVTKAGYVFIRKPDHPNADKRGYIREHVFIMSQSLGRPIAQNEVVHHINGDPSDNREENLIVMTRSAHHSFHHKGLIKPKSIANIKGGKTSEEMKEIWRTSRKHQRMKPKICDYCGNEFYKPRLKGRSTHKRQFCNRTCYQASRKIKDH